MPITIEHFEFTRFDNEENHLYAIEINPGVDFRKILSFGFILRPPVPNPNNNIYGITGELNIHSWVAGWYFGVTYRMRCQKGNKIFGKNVAYTNIIAPDFMANGWIIIPHYFNNFNDQGVDFFKAIPITTNLAGFYHPEYQEWKEEIPPIIGNPIINPNIPVHNYQDLAVIIREAKTLL